MNEAEFNEFCASLQGVTYVQQWGNSHVWKVGGKVFAICGLNKESQRGITFKASQLNFQFLLEKEYYRPAPYLASRGFTWIQQFNAPDALAEELHYYLKESHRLVASGLSKKKQRELGLM